MKKLVMMVAAFALMFSFSCSKEEKDSVDVVRFVEVGWSDIISTTSVAEEVLNSIGYETERSMVSVPIAFKALQNKDADVFLGYWNPSMTSQVRPYAEKGEVDILSENLTGAKYTLAVPQYVYDAGVIDFSDIAENAEKFENKIYGIEAGNDGNQLIIDMIGKNEFSLGGFEIVESSEAGMLGAVEKKIKNEEWIVFLAWAPHPMNTSYNIQYLSGGDDYFGSDYGAATVHTCVWGDFAVENPNLAKFFRQLKFSVAMESEIMGAIADGEDANEAALEYIKKHPELLQKWLEGVKSADGENAVEVAKAHFKQLSQAASAQ